MWSIRSVLFLLLLSLSGASVCQNTFSFRTWSTFNTGYKAVHEIDGEYYVVGSRWITGDFPFSQFTLSRFNLEGELQELTGHGSDSLSFEVRFDATSVMDNEMIVLAHNGFIQGQSYMFLNWISTNGDLFQQENFQSPYLVDDPEAFETFLPLDMKINEASEIFVVSVVESSEANGFDTYITKHTSTGVMLWDAIFEAPLTSNARSLNITEEGVLICHGSVNFDNEELIDKWLVFFDDEGSETWIDYQTGVIVDHAEESVYDNDLVTIVTGISFDASNSLVPVIYQINMEGELQWLTFLDVDPVDNIEQYYSELVQTSDDGFVAGGFVYDTSPDNVEQNGDFNWDVILAKYNFEGEEIWTRRYNRVASLDDEHIIVDLIQTSDDGFLFCGYANDWANETPELIAYQQGWLVKTDEHGCLVPGCHVSVEEFEEENGYFKIGPNPASSQGYLNVFYSEVEPLDKATLTITNSLGQVVQTVAMRNNAMTYLIDLNGFGAGNYQVQLSDVNGVRQVERLVVW
jgi:hypothetical protein